MHNPESFRGIFFHIKEGMTYLNHAAISPLSKPVTDSVVKYLNNRSSNSIDNFDFLTEQLFSTKEKLARLFGTVPERIAFVDNTSDGLNILANGLDWKTGDRILLNTMEFPSNVYPFMNLERRGVEIDFIEPYNNTIPLEKIMPAVTPRTRLISISHVQYLNGFLTDLEALGAFCRKHGIIFSVDVIQSAGAAPIDVDKTKIDFLASGSHKWLMGPEGVGFIYLTEEMQSRITQAYVGWTSVSNYFERMRDFKLELDPTARRYENGMLNSAGIIGLGASLDVLFDVGIESIREHILDLTDHLIAQLDERDITYITPSDRSERSGIVSFKPVDTEALVQVMTERKVHTAVRGECVRVSPHFYNTIEEIDILVNCIDECMKVEKV